MITTTKKYNRTNRVQYKGEEMFVYRHDKDKVCISPDPKFKRAIDLNWVSVEDISPARKVGVGIVGKPKVLNSEQKVVKSELNVFFEDMAKVMPFNCCNCNKPLYAYNTFAKRSCTAHLLPKSLFPTIATNIHNVTFLGPSILGICNCHNLWDDRDSEQRKSMNVYPEAVDNFSKYLRHELNNEDFISACDYLGLNFKDYENN